MKDKLLTLKIELNHQLEGARWGWFSRDYDKIKKLKKEIKKI